jgi:hypothetical protein
VTKSTKEKLSALEAEQENLQISITTESIKRPILDKEQIKFWIMKFAKTDVTNENERQKLIDVFVNSVYVYDDKMIITFNYKDGEKIVDLSQVSKVRRRTAILLKITVRT